MANDNHLSSVTYYNVTMLNANYDVCFGYLRKYAWCPFC